MKILITGGTGFIGTHVIERLLLMSEHELIVTSRDLKKAKEKSWFEFVQYMPYDLKEHRSDIFDYFNRPDVLIHLAWCDVHDVNSENHMTEINDHFDFIFSLIRNGLRDINITGTCQEYGLLDGCLREHMDIKPVTNYGVAKNILKELLTVLNSYYNFQLKWIRLFYVYGEGQPKNSLLPQLKKALDSNLKVFNMSKGLQKRDFISVKDTTSNIVKIVLQDNVVGVINNCNGRSISVLDFVKKYIKKSGKEIELNLGFYSYPDYESMDFWGDCKKLKSI